MKTHSPLATILASLLSAMLIGGPCILAAVLLSCSRADPDDRVQAPPKARWQMVERVFQNTGGAPAQGTGIMEPKTVSASDLVAAATRAGVGEVVCLSERYAVLDSGWFSGQFTDCYQKYLRQLGIEYTEDQFVCGQYATLAWSWAVAGAARDRVGFAPAVGWMIYTPHPGDPAARHAITVLFDGEAVVFLEPQVQKGYAFRPLLLEKARLAGSTVVF